MSMSLAAVAAGSDGLIIEVHPDPDRARSDGAQSLSPDEFAKMMAELQPYISIWKKERAAAG